MSSFDLRLVVVLMVTSYTEALVLGEEKEVCMR